MDAQTEFGEWMNRIETLRQRIDALSVKALAATLDLEIEAAYGKALPPGWHWLYFNPKVRGGLLGEDGHPRRDYVDSFLPPIPLPRRMWAGSRIRYLRELPIGADAVRTSRTLSIATRTVRPRRLDKCRSHLTSLFNGGRC